MMATQRASGGDKGPRVTVFTTPACHWCLVAKRYLDDAGIEYTECDVHADRTALREMVLMTGQHGVPVIRVGTRAMIGWDPGEFEELMYGPPSRR